MKVELWLVIVLVIIFTILGLLIGYTIRRLWIAMKGPILTKREQLLSEATIKAEGIIKTAKLEAKKQDIINQEQFKQILEESRVASENLINKARQEFEVEVKSKRKTFLNEEKYLKQRQNNLFKNEQELEDKTQEIFNKKVELDALTQWNLNKKLEWNHKLTEIAKISESEAKEEIMQKIRKDAFTESQKFLEHNRNTTQLKAKQQAVDIIIQALERYATDVVNEKTTTVIEIPSEDMKGRIIGKEGRNIRAFEKYAGVDLIVDETPGIVTVSCFDPIRREIAFQALQKLLIDGRIQPVRIEDVLLETKAMIDDIIIQTGSEVVKELNIFDINNRLVKLIGRLKYRTSFNQNVLAHSIEVAKLAGTIAAELGLETSIAVRSGLLHDIGKALDFEREGSHVTLGVEIANDNNESEAVVNAIAAHHGDAKPTSPYSFIVMIADTLSAARPGARSDTLANFLERMRELEDLCKSVDGVNNAYVFKSGRQIQVMVDPQKVDDNRSNAIAAEISDSIKSNKKIPGDITVTVIREYKTKQKII